MANQVTPWRGSLGQRIEALDELIAKTLMMSKSVLESARISMRDFP